MLSDQPQQLEGAGEAAGREHGVAGVPSLIGPRYRQPSSGRLSLQGAALDHFVIHPRAATPDPDHTLS